jgi:hypothetical protein
MDVVIEKAVADFIGDSLAHCFSSLRARTLWCSGGPPCVSVSGLDD